MNERKRDDSSEKGGRTDGLDSARTDEHPEGMVRRDALRVLGAGALGAVSVLTSSAEAQTPAPLATGTARALAERRTAVGLADAAQAVSITVSGNSQLLGLSVKRAGGPLRIDLTVKTRGSGARTIPWRVAVDGKELNSGATKQASGESSFTVSASWNATSGVHTFTGVVDPENTLREPAAGRQDNIRECTAEFDQWVTWGDDVFSAVLNAVHEWQQVAHFANVVVNAVTATGAPGCLVGPELEPLIKQAAELGAATGTFKTVGDKFAKVVGAKWKAWQSAVTVPGLPWYPAFAAFPGPMAPPMPNTPFPLMACTSSKLSDMATASSLKTALAAELKELATTTHAGKVIDAFATTLSQRFSSWIVTVQAMSILGTGPVPSFAPPYVPVGPVVAGTVLPTPGHLLNKLF